jgi:hypothetical protein
MAPGVRQKGTAVFSSSSASACLFQSSFMACIVHACFGLHLQGRGTSARRRGRPGGRFHGEIMLSGGRSLTIFSAARCRLRGLQIKRSGEQRSPGKVKETRELKIFGILGCAVFVKKSSKNSSVFLCRLGQGHALNAHVESVMRLKRVDSHIIRTAQTV